jgi:hypothetical protein
MRRPLAAALLSGLAVLGAAGTAVAAEGPQRPALEQIPGATLFDFSGQDGASQDGAEQNTTSQDGQDGQDGTSQNGTAQSAPAQNGSQREDDPQLLPDPQPDQQAGKPQNGEDASPNSQHSSAEGQEAIGEAGGLGGLKP